MWHALLTIHTICHTIVSVKYFDWDETKNQQLKEKRNISFEEVKVAVESDKALDVFDHPNQKRYPGQKIMIVEIDNYAYVVPFIEYAEKYFLKTIFPSRKATKKYVRSK